MFKKSISYNKQKKIGEIIKKDDLDFIKNSKAPSPIFSHSIVGKRVLKNIKKNESLDLKKINNRIGAIIVARMTSKRLPKKAIQKINGENSLTLVMEVEIIFKEDLDK